MGTRFFLESLFTTSSLRTSGAILTPGGATVVSDLSSAGGAPPAASFTSGELVPVPVTVCSLFAVGLVRLVLLPGIDFDLAIVGYSLHSPKFRNVLSCSANHIYLVSITSKRTVEILLTELIRV